MKVILEEGPLLLLRFDKGENVLEGISDYAQQEQINAALFTAIGASAEVTLSYYDLTQKVYVDTSLKEDLEIVSVTGNIGIMHEQPIIHAHGVFANREFRTFGGHIKKIIVSATCEVTLTVLDGELARAHDEETGLNLLK